jgi:hypothetical protein
VFPENVAAGLALADQVLLVCGFSKIMLQTSSLRFAPNSIRNCAGAWDAELVSCPLSLHIDKAQIGLNHRPPRFNRLVALTVVN